MECSDCEHARDYHIAPREVAPRACATTTASTAPTEARTLPRRYALQLAADAHHLRGCPVAVARHAYLVGLLLESVDEPELAAHFAAEARRLEPERGGRQRVPKT